MKAKVVAIESGSQYTDGRRRVTVELVRPEKDRSYVNTRLTLRDRELGFAAVRLDDEVEITFSKPDGGAS